jgi:hypothetical protein
MFQNDRIKGERTKQLQMHPLTVLRVIVCFRLQKIVLAMCPGVPLFNTGREGRWREGMVYKRINKRKPRPDATLVV